MQGVLDCSYSQKEEKGGFCKIIQSSCKRFVDEDDILRRATKIWNCEILKRAEVSQQDIQTGQV